MGKEVELNWQNHSNGITEQRIYRSVDGGQEVLVTAVAAAVKSFTDPVVGTPSTLTYKVGSVYINNGEEHVVASNPLSITLPQPATAKPMIGETAGQDLNIMAFSEIKLTVDGNVIPGTGDAGYWSYSVPWTGVPQVIEVNSTDLTSPLPAMSIAAGLGKITQWADVGYSVTSDVSLMLGGDITEVPATLHPSITSLSGMFFIAANFNDPNVSNWDTSNVTNMESVFNGATTFNQPLYWTTTAVTTTKSMFAGAASFNSDISDMNFTSITEMARMFMGATAFNQPVAGKFNLTNVTRPQAVFEAATSFNQPIDWDFSNVIDLNGFFANATSFNQDISGWNVSNVSEFHEMFNGTTAFDTDLSAWNVSGGYGMTNMFAGTTYLDRHDLSVWCVAHIPDQPSGFEGNATTPAHIPVWGTCPRGEIAQP